MDIEQGLYLTQARSDFHALRALKGADPCHQIHYLQMATEKLAKAYFWRVGKPLKKRHDFFVKFLRAARKRGDIGRILGIKPTANWEAYVDSVLPVTLAVEQMAPSEAGDGPNAEYPWPHEAPEQAPATFAFPVWDEIAAPHGQKFLGLLGRLLDNFEKFA